MAVLQIYNIQLMSIADYKNVKKLRGLYKKFHYLGELARTGDTVAASIYIDLKTALYHEGVLTDMQRECIIGHLIEHSTYRELEPDLMIDKSTIHYHINIGLKRLQTALESGVLYERY